MTTPSDAALAATAAVAKPLRQVRAFTRWVGAGRKLTQRGRITLSDARELVGLLGTADEIDPRVGDRVFRTRSSEELPGITLIAEWAKESGLVRVTGGRLVQVKRHAGLLGHPLELWARMFEAFPRLGEALCVSGWGESLLRENFEEALGAVLAELTRGAITPGGACALAWETVAGGYVLDDLSDQQLATFRALNDRDVRHALEVLQEVGAVRGGDQGTVEPTELALWALGRTSQAPAPGDPILQIWVTLAGMTDPPVWRRLLVPAATRLDRLHQVIQAAMAGRTTTCTPSPTGGSGTAGRTRSCGSGTSARRRWVTCSQARAAGPATPTTSVTTGSTSSWWRSGSPPSRAWSTRCAWPARVPARPRTAAAHGATSTCAKSSPTQPATSTRTCWCGWGWTRRPTSTPTGST
jgi:hypothetical protein